MLPVLRTAAFVLALFMLVRPGSAADYKPIVIDPSLNHDRFNTQPKDIVRMFRAYMVSFDGRDDNDRDGDSDTWGIPEWVAYEMRSLPDELPRAPRRPRPWMTDLELFEDQIAPSDSSYLYSREFRANHPEIDYVRGHMCMKLIGFRQGPEADWNTHTMLNACPQRSKLNGGIWLDLENRTIDWTQANGRLWVICGPIVDTSRPLNWIGEEGELPVVIPDAFFKIVVRKEPDASDPDVLAFIYPQEHELYDERPYRHEDFLVSVDEIESRTGLDFLTMLHDTVEEEIEATVAEELWEF